MIQAIQWFRKANGQNIIRECTDAWLVSEELQTVSSRCANKKQMILLNLPINLVGVYTAKPTFDIYQPNLKYLISVCWNSVNQI